MLLGKKGTLQKSLSRVSLGYAFGKSKGHSVVHRVAQWLQETAASNELPQTILYMNALRKNKIIKSCSMSAPPKPVNTVTYSANLWYSGDILESICHEQNFPCTVWHRVALLHLNHLHGSVDLSNGCGSWQCTGQHVGDTKAKVIAIACYHFSVSRLYRSWRLSNEEIASNLSDVYRMGVLGDISQHFFFCPKKLPYV